MTASTPGQADRCVGSGRSGGQSRRRIWSNYRWARSIDRPRRHLSSSSGSLSEAHGEEHAGRGHEGELGRGASSEKPWHENGQNRQGSSVQGRDSSDVLIRDAFDGAYYGADVSLCFMFIWEGKNQPMV